MPDLRRDGDVYLLNLGDDENRFHPDWVAAVSEALREVEAAEAPRALVTHAEGRFFSNGLDLEWLAANTGEAVSYVGAVQGLLAQVLGAGVPTVVAIQGHCFAAGAMLALAHDTLVMRADRGFFCLPEADIGIPFTTGINDLVASRLPRRTAHEAMVTGRRYGGSDALAAGIVHEAVGEDEVLPRAIELAQAQAAKSPQTLATIKQRLYRDALKSLAESAQELATPPAG